MLRSLVFPTRLSPWLLVLVVAACSSSTPTRLGSGAGGNGGDGDTSGSGSGSGPVNGCAALLACCASITDQTAQMTCITSEQMVANTANGAQECAAVLAQYQTAGTCAVTTTTGTTGAGGASGSGCAALSACCAMFADTTAKQQCMTSEAQLAATPNGDAECAQAAMSYATANLCMPAVTTTASSTGSFTTGVGGMGASSSSAGPSSNTASSSKAASSSSSSSKAASTAVASSSSSSGSGGNIIPTTCAQAHGNPGCCGPNGELYFCNAGALPVTPQACAAPDVCGWDATNGYYNCVPAPGEADPSGVNPIACGP